MAMKKPQKAEDAAAIRTDRARGALMGLAVGDALGAPLETKRLPAPPFPKLTDGPYKEMTGGGPFAVKPGQVTDETQMACCIAASLRALKRYDASDVMKRYLAWQPVGFSVSPQALQALKAQREGGLAAQNPGRHAWLQSGRKNIGNNSLARTAPIGVYLARDAEARTKASLEDSALTHYDPRCQLACAALNGAIGQAISGPTDRDLKPEELVDGASLALSLGGALLGKISPELVQETQAATELLRAELELARKDDPLLYGPELHMHREQQMGSVQVAFRLAWWELFHARSFEAALVDVVNRGGDADSNAAVCGALLGAFYGERQIPERWRKAVLDALSTGRPGPLWDVYHPRQLLALVEG